MFHFHKILSEGPEQKTGIGVQCQEFVWNNTSSNLHCYRVNNREESIGPGPFQSVENFPNLINTAKVKKINAS